MVEYAYNPSMWGIGAGRSQVWIEHGLHSKTVREGNGRMGIEKEGKMEGKKKKKERSQYWCSRSPRELSLKSEPISPRTKRLGIPFAPVTKPISIWPPPSPVYSPGPVPSPLQCRYLRCLHLRQEQGEVSTNISPWGLWQKIIRMETTSKGDFWLVSEKSSAEHRHKFQMPNAPALWRSARPPASSSDGFLSASQR